MNYKISQHALNFWRFISGSDTLYTDLIEPMGRQARLHSEDYLLEVSKKINRFTQEIGARFFMPDGGIDWELLVQYISQRRDDTPYPFE